MQGIIVEILNSLGVKKDDKVLDFGCGDSRLVKFINENGFICYGADIQEDRISEAKKIFQESFLNPDFLRVIQTERDGYTIKDEEFKLPFEDNFFDYIVSFQVFEHISNLEEVIKELYRVIKVGGKIYLEFPSTYTIVEPHLEIPFVHYLKYSKFRENYIYFFAKLKKIDEPRKYAKMQNDYLKTSCFYRNHNEFDKMFKDGGFTKKDYSYERRSLRMQKDKVFTLRELLLYKQRRYDNKSSLESFSYAMNIYLKLHSFFYSMLRNRMLVFTKETK
nr:class I SAM-dependent methyltransferase [uncultured Sulfurimonas sp.]